MRSTWAILCANYRGQGLVLSAPQQVYISNFCSYTSKPQGSPGGGKKWKAETICPNCHLVALWNSFGTPGLKKQAASCIGQHFVKMEFISLPFWAERGWEGSICGKGAAQGARLGIYLKSRLLWMWCWGGHLLMNSSWSLRYQGGFAFHRMKTLSGRVAVNSNASMGHWLPS